MGDPLARVCIDRAIPEAAETELAVTRSKKWPNGKHLRVRFLDGTPAIQAKVRTYAEAWHPFANITFEFVSDGPAEIRVSSPRIRNSPPMNSTPATKGVRTFG